MNTNILKPKQENKTFFDDFLQLDEAKILFNYVLDNPDIIETTELNLFYSQTFVDIIFRIIKNHYNKYKIIPDYNIIKIELEKSNEFEKLKISENTIKSLFNQDIYIQEKTRRDKGYLENLYNHHNMYKYIRNHQSKEIDELINIKCDFNKLKIKAQELGYTNNTIEENIDILEDPSLHTPFIEDFVYENLPNILKQTTNVIENKREKDILLLSELTVLSSLFSNVYSLNDTLPITCNLYTFIIGKSASGKGKVRYAKFLIDKILKKHFDFIIAGDNSSANLIKDLHSNDGVGLIVESEADTIAKNLATEWGKGLSSTLRDGFDNNEIRSSRKGNNNETEKLLIKILKLSVLLSGTKDQYFTFMNNAENGLFSRFLHYVFNQKTIVRNTYLSAVKGSKQINNKTNFEQIYGETICELYEYYLKFGDIQMLVNNEQAVKAFRNNERNLDYVKAFYTDDDAESMAIRLGVMSHKIAMVLSLIRNFENRGMYEDAPDKLIETEININDVDWELSLSIVNTLLHHAKVIFISFPIDPKKMKVSLKQNDAERLFIDMPNEFTRSEIHRIGKNRYSRMGDRKIDALISEWLKLGKIKKADGKYLKSGK